MRRVCEDTAVKLQVAKTLASMGLTLSDAMRVFPSRVVADQALPFAPTVPNAIRRIRPPRQFIRDWQRLSQAGRHDLNRRKEAMTRRIANEGPLAPECPRYYVVRQVLGTTLG
ncbi:type II toxin-antitoxin system RelB/DinJ family antitoxin [Pandoraea sputorum]|uniref:Damage-inducible protein n=1 Tax=Pandoraea sputorum TaxID=93222 RepID=A0A5E5BLK8_9BURK|nr:type II toxin-antitoxin system RelB/DinJ family antitoxin [Pandoraea sputorum]VVE86002.1 damage-inducible protein [Pandoraea sputorum]